MMREAEIKLAGGKTTGEVCRELGISEQSYYRWRREYGGMQVCQARKRKDLEREDVRLKKLVAEKALDKAGTLTTDAWSASYANKCLTEQSSIR